MHIVNHGPGGSTDLERGYGDVRPWRPPFHASPVVRRVPFQAKLSVYKTPFWENLEILASTASIIAQILAHKPPNLWTLSAHKPPNLEIFSSSSQASNLEIFSSQAPPPHPGSIPLPEKKNWVPPPRPWGLRAPWGGMCPTWVGHSRWKAVRDVLWSWPLSFFRPVDTLYSPRLPIYHQFAIHVPPYCQF